MMDLTLPKAGGNGVEVASRGESKPTWNHTIMDLVLPQKQEKNGVEVASHGESKTHVKPYNRGPSFALKAREEWDGRSRFAWKWSSIPFAYFDLVLNIVRYTEIYYTN